MMRKLVCATVLAGLMALFTLALNAGQKDDDKNVMRGKITKVDGNKITFQVFNAETKKLGEARELQTADNAKFFEIKGKERQPVSDGLKADQFKNLGEKGHWAAIRVEGDRVTEIRLMDRLEEPKDGAQ